MKLADQNIIIISNEPWGDMWYSKHNYAYELSKKNKVVFINPCARWSISNWFNRKAIFKQVGESLYTLDYRNMFPTIFLKWNNRIVSKRIKKELNRQGIVNPIYWSFDPYRLMEPKLLTNKPSILHPVDKFKFEFPAEEISSRNVDKMITCSSEIVEVYERFNKPMLVIPHGISSEEFKSDTIPEEIKHIEKYGLYIGGIDYRLNFALIEKLVAENPTTPFVFIGPLNLPTNSKQEQDLFTNKKFQNLIYLGPKPFKELKHFIANSSFCLAPMEISSHGNTISHHKIFQYLAFGKPVFSIVFSEYLKFEKLLYMNNDIDEIAKSLSTFLASGEAKKLEEERIEIAKANTYESLFKQIEEFLA